MIKIIKSVHTMLKLFFTTLLVHKLILELPIISGCTFSYTLGKQWLCLSVFWAVCSTSSTQVIGKYYKLQVKNTRDINVIIHVLCFINGFYCYKQRCEVSSKLHYIVLNDWEKSWPFFFTFFFSHLWNSFKQTHTQSQMKCYDFYTIVICIHIIGIRLRLSLQHEQIY